MRDVILTLFVFGSIPQMFRKPDFGLMVFTWLSLMNPHKLCWGFARGLPFAAAAAAATLSGLLVWKEPKTIPWIAPSILLALRLGWVTFTTFFALNPEAAWVEWNVIWKIQLVTFLIMMVMTTRERIIKTTWVIALSMGFYGVKGGIFTLTTGGGARVYGPEGTMLGGNNEVALALIMAIPLLRFLQLSTTRAWVRHGMAAAMFLSLVCTLGSQSRGAIVGAAAMLLFLILKSRNKLPLILMLALAIPPMLAFMPDSWYERMATIKTYQKDGSAMGRINAWTTAVNIAKSRVVGGGLKALQSHKVYRMYAPNPEDIHDAHSIYFQEIAEHGFIGLALFLFIGLTSWKTASRTIKLCRDHPNLKWVSDLNAMIQVGVVGYASSGLFLGLANFDLYYDFVALIVCSHVYTKKAIAEEIADGKPESAPESKPGPKSFVRPVVKPYDILSADPKPLGNRSGQL